MSEKQKTYNVFSFWYKIKMSSIDVRTGYHNNWIGQIYYAWNSCTELVFMYLVIRCFFA